MFGWFVFASVFVVVFLAVMARGIWVLEVLDARRRSDAELRRIANLRKVDRYVDWNQL